MTMRAITGGMLWPPTLVVPAGAIGGVSITSGITIDAADEKAAQIFPAPKAGSVTKIHFKVSTVAAGGPTSVDVRLETVSTTDGNPTGTLWATNTNASASVTETSDSLWFTVTMTAAATVALDDMLAVVIVNPGTQSIIIQGALGTQGTPTLSSLEYAVPYTTSWGTKTKNVNCIGIEYSDGTIYFPSGVYPWDDVSAGAFFLTSSVADGQQAGVKLTATFAGTVSAVGLHLSLSTTRGNVIAKVYKSTDLTTAVATSAEIDRDIQITTSGIYFHLLRVTPFNVSVGDVLYVVLQASGAAVNATRMLFKASFAVDTRPGVDAGAVRVTRAGTTGSFTEVSNEINMATLYFSHIDDGNGLGRASLNIGV